MKRRILLLSHVLICILILTVSLSCNSNASKSGSDKPITEQEVKQYLTIFWTGHCESYMQCSIQFDSPVRIADVESHTFQTGITVDAYPVKVDFTTSTLNKDLTGAVPVISHHTGGVYYFYRNSFKEWEMDKEGVNDIN